MLHIWSIVHPLLDSSNSFFFAIATALPDEIACSIRSVLPYWKAAGHFERNPCAIGVLVQQEAVRNPNSSEAAPTSSVGWLWQMRSNADVVDGGIRKGTRSDEIRPMIRPWPLPMEGSLSGAVC
jgi:hypothetical protein